MNTTGVLLVTVLPLAWAAVWYLLRRFHAVPYLWLRILIIVGWVFLGGLLQGNGVIAGIPGVVELLLFPLLPFAMGSELRHLAWRNGLESGVGENYRALGMLVSIPLMVNCLFAHLFLWSARAKALRAVPEAPAENDGNIRNSHPTLERNLATTGESIVENSTSAADERAIQDKQVSESKLHSFTPKPSRWIPFVLIAVLIVALNDVDEDSGYYDLLRWAMCVGCGWTIWGIHKPTTQWWQKVRMCVLGALMVVFNPIAPPRFRHADWETFTVAAAILLAVFGIDWRDIGRLPRQTKRKLAASLSLAGATAIIIAGVAMGLGEWKRQQERLDQRDFEKWQTHVTDQLDKAIREVKQSGDELKKLLEGISAPSAAKDKAKFAAVTQELHETAKVEDRMREVGKKLSRSPVWQDYVNDSLRSAWTSKKSLLPEFNALLASYRTEQSEWTRRVHEARRLVDSGTSSASQ